MPKDSKPLAPAILLSGDSFLTDQKFSSLLNEIRSKKKGEVTSQVYYLSEKPLADVLKEARNLPFLAVAQVFRLKEAGKLKQKDLEPLVAYLDKPSSEAFLIFEGDSIEKSHALSKLLSKKGQAFFVEPAEKKSASSRFIREKMKYAKKTMGRGALMRVEEMAGEAPSFLNSILDQLILYSAESPEITEEMITKFEENWNRVDVFTLTDAIASRKTGKALVLLKELLEENNGDIFSLLGLLHWQIRRFWQARVLLDEGKPEGAFLKKCRVSPRQAPFFKRQLQAFSRLKLEKALEGLFQMDWKVKTGQTNGPLALEQWVVNVTS